MRMQIEKEFAPRSGMRLIRLMEPHIFTCSRCSEAKKSKLFARPDVAPHRCLCNGCYGYLLSVFDIKKGSQSEEEKSSLLAAALLQVFSRAQKQGSERLFRIAEKRADYLDFKSVLFLSTANLVEDALAQKHELDWSPAVIGYCKAVENEIVRRLIDLLVGLVKGSLSRADLDDKDFGRVAKYCNSPSNKPPELGVFAHFLQTFALSTSRRATSGLLHAFDSLICDLPRRDWLIDRGGLSPSLTKLCSEYRNRAAQVESLSRADYLACREFVCGTDGLIWKIVSATLGQKEYNRA
jgi:hypothetical protein